MVEAAAKTIKGGQTRALILETALDLFDQHGYDETTMRMIAEEAGVALGNTYYYFRSKESLIQAFYERICVEQFAAATQVLQTERTLKGRLQGVMMAELTVFAKYHRFFGAIFKIAADPASPLNPFSPEYQHLRQRSISIFREALDGAKTQIPNDLKSELPLLFWLYHMGVILFWIHDRSDKFERTQRLVEHTIDLITKMIALFSTPVTQPLRKMLIRTIRSIQEVTGIEATKD